MRWRSLPMRSGPARGALDLISLQRIEIDHDGTTSV